MIGESAGRVAAGRLHESVKNAETEKMPLCCEKNAWFGVFLEENQKSVKLTTNTECEIWTLFEHILLLKIKLCC